jgi:ribA/ribD-fused uncharacterized protein
LFEHDTALEEAIHFSRFDEDNVLSTVSLHGFELEEYRWPTAEHYYQAHKYEGLNYASKILAATSGRQAHELGNVWLKRKVSGWKERRRVWMTRALYRKMKEYDEVQDALLETDKNLIIETSMYDHYWGLGRDQRGENMLGKVWMDIRSKLQNAP